MSLAPPAAETLALCGIAFVGLFGIWAGHIAPRVARWRDTVRSRSHVGPPNV